MPHIAVKVREGYSQAEKVRLAEALADAIVETLDCPMFDVSVGIEDVRITNWGDYVYRPDILGKSATIYKEPGYEPPV